MFKHFEEDPLRPLVIVLVGRIYDFRPIEREADFFKLIGKSFDIRVRDLTGMDTCFYGIVLGRKSERVETDREEDIIPFHTLFSRDDFKPAVSLYMSDVHSRAARIGKLDERVKLFLRSVLARDENFFLIPAILPFFFDFRKIVIHFFSSPLSHQNPYRSPRRLSKNVRDRKTHALPC